MSRAFISVFYCFIFCFCSAQTVRTPDQIYGPLFVDVQAARIFPDSKTFVDCVPRRDPAAIVGDYVRAKSNPALRFSLKLFVASNFVLPDTSASTYITGDKNIVEHMNSLWTVLERKSDSLRHGSSLLPLPHAYIVPGGRFREIYYWDSYFTLLGLKESKRYDLIESMVNNFAYLISEYGHVPNGNRSYYLSRSQPPFFSLMIELLAELKGPEVYVRYQPALEKEYDYWMDKSGQTRHLVRMPDGTFLNRYWDQLAIPRQESYREDVSLARGLPSSKQNTLFRDLRSAAESGWDFSSRWFLKGGSLQTIQTTSLVPVDLNCLLYHLEKTLAKSYALSGSNVKANYLSKTAEQRKRSINRYCWSSTAGWYVDYHIVTKKSSTSLTLAGMFPFFLRLSDEVKFAKARLVLQNQFLKYGGLVTTLVNTGQQWDAPIGWAPLQWISIVGLEHYGEKKLPRTIAGRWYSLNTSVFLTTGKLMEKYDVVHRNKAGGGGEYPSQDGFGWTNGVLLALINKYNLDND